MNPEDRYKMTGSYGNVLDEVMRGTAAEGEVSNAGNVLVAGAYVEIVKGQNRPVIFSTYKHQEEVPLLQLLCQAAPSMLGAMAEARLLSESDVHTFAKKAPDILMAHRPSNRPINILKKLLKGDE